MSKTNEIVSKAFAAGASTAAGVAAAGTMDAAGEALKKRYPEHKLAINIATIVGSTVAGFGLQHLVAKALKRLAREGKEALLTEGFFCYQKVECSMTILVPGKE